MKNFSETYTIYGTFHFATEEWQFCICLGADHQESVPVWEIMSPKEFYTFTIPFDISGPTKVSRYKQGKSKLTDVVL